MMNDVNAHVFYYTLFAEIAFYIWYILFKVTNNLNVETHREQNTIFNEVKIGLIHYRTKIFSYNVKRN